MKRGLLALLTAGCVVLTGCEAVLERSYEATTPHVDRPTVGEDSSILQVENYRELVSAVLYLVSQGAEEGEIQLQNYAGEAEADLAAACLEVATEDPLGAYAVDYIKHEITRVVSYDQAAISIRYCRTPEQIRSMVNVTGTSAIRAELREAMDQFSEEVVLRVAYCAEDEASIAQLIRQAYYDGPLTALGMPQAEITLYPDSGSQRVVEILMTYPDSAEQLRQKSGELSIQAESIAALFRGMEPGTAALRAAAELQEHAAYAPEGGVAAYDALVTGQANEEGLALAYTLLCRQAGLSSQVVEGRRQGESWFWNEVELAGGERRFLDPAAGDGRLYTAQEMLDRGYLWPGSPEGEETGQEEPSLQ